MSYEKHTWVSGEKITSARLNEIENAIEDNGYDVIISCPNGYFSNQPGGYSIIKGDYSSLINKIQNNSLIDGIIYCSYDYEHTGGNNDFYTNIPLVGVHWDQQQQNIELFFRILTLDNRGEFTVDSISITEIRIFIEADNSISEAIWQPYQSITNNEQ